MILQFFFEYWVLNIKYIIIFTQEMGIGDWGLGFGDWSLGIGDWGYLFGKINKIYLYIYKLKIKKF